MYWEKCRIMNDEMKKKIVLGFRNWNRNKVDIRRIEEDEREILKYCIKE